MRDFSTIPILAFRETLISQPIGLLQKPPGVPRAVGVSVNWADYGVGPAKVNLGITVFLSSTGSPVQGLDQCRSVYVDNTNSNVPIYVQFPDTKFTVVIPPNSSGWYPVVTNALLAVIYGIGFTPTVPKTSVYFTNLFIPAYIDTELPTALTMGLATKNLIPGSTIPDTATGYNALGDESESLGYDLNTLAPAVLWGTPRPSGFIYLKAIDVSLFNTQRAAGRAQGNIVLGLAGSFRPVITVIFLAPVAAADYSVPLFNLSGFQRKLDATVPWFITSLGNVSLDVGSLATITSFYTASDL